MIVGMKIRISILNEHRKKSINIGLAKKKNKHEMRTFNHKNMNRERSQATNKQTRTSAQTKKKAGLVKENQPT